MSATPTLRIDPDGFVYALSGDDLATANAAIAMDDGGDLYAVRLAGSEGYWQDTEPVWEPNTALYRTELVVLDNGEYSYTPVTITTAGGRGISDTVVEYLGGSSATTPPSGDWSIEPPTVSSGQFLWTRTTLEYTAGPNTVSYSVSKQGEKGDQGVAGDKGEDGLTTYFHVAYATDANGSGFSTTDPTGRSWIGTYTDTTSEDSTNWQSYDWAQFRGADGATGQQGPAGKGISSSTVTYAKSTSGTAAPTSGWASTIPAAAAGEFVWTRTIIQFTDGGSTTTYSVGKIGDTGAQGDKGDEGEQGVSVVNVIPYYRAAASQPANPTGSSPAGWTTTQPDYAEGLTMWRSERVHLSTGVYQWTPVTKVTDYEVATNAIYVSNLAQQQADGLIWTGQEEPPHEARVNGQIWFKTSIVQTDTGPEERMAGIYKLVDPEPIEAVWQTYTMITGLFIVPGEDGEQATIIDQNGAVFGTIDANSITGREIKGESIGTELLAVGAVTQGVLEQGLRDNLTKMFNRVVITPTDITISQSAAGSDNLTALQLTASRMTFTVDNNPAVYIDSKLNLMSIDNAVIRETIQVGEHQIRRMGAGITNFTWIGSNN